MAAKRTHPTKAAARASGNPPRSEWTVGGKPIPDQVAHLIPFENTYQGIAQLNDTDERSGSGVEVRDRFDRQIDARIDAGDGKIELWSAPDPAKEAIDRVREPGFKYRLLSKRMIDERGLRGFEIVRDKKTNEPVTMGDRMLIGRMPETMAEQRDRYYRGLSDEAVRDAEQYHQQEQERIIRDGTASGVSPLKPGDILRDTQDGERVATVGLHARRGNASHFPE